MNIDGLVADLVAFLAQHGISTERTIPAPYRAIAKSPRIRDAGPTELPPGHTAWTKSDGRQPVPDLGPVDTVEGLEYVVRAKTSRAEVIARDIGVLMADIFVDERQPKGKNRRTESKKRKSILRAAALADRLLSEVTGIAGEEFPERVDKRRLTGDLDGLVSWGEATRRGRAAGGRPKETPQTELGCLIANVLEREGLPLSFNLSTNRKRLPALEGVLALVLKAVKEPRGPSSMKRLLRAVREARQPTPRRK